MVRVIDVGPEPLAERFFDRGFGDATEEHRPAELDPLATSRVVGFRPCIAQFYLGSA